MKRVFKFRAFVKFYGMQEITGFQIIKEKFVTLFDGEGFHAGIPFEDIEIMQYIGLKDKNGKEIYEGDIIKADSFNPKIYEIKYYVTGFYAFNPKSSYLEIDSFHSSEGCEFEIIGNIYENPELLEHQ